MNGQDMSQEVPEFTPEDDKLVYLIDRLSRPIFIFRMARNSPKKGSDIRMKNALAEARKLLSEYVSE